MHEAEILWKVEHHFIKHSLLYVIVKSAGVN